MMLTQEVPEQIITTLKSKYGTWTGFHEPAFLADEVDYKRKIIADAKPFLEQARFRELLDSAQFDDFIKQLVNAAQKSVNLLYLSTPKSGDLRIIYGLPVTEQAAFCHAFYDLLYSEGTSPQRLGRYVAYLQSASLPNYWTFPTYYLSVTDPAHDIFIKPRTIQKFFRSIRAPTLWSASPSADAYATIIGVAEELRELLSEYGPEDMVDIQSAMYVCGDTYSPNPVLNQPNSPATSHALGYPFSQIFNSYAEAESALDLLRLALEYLGVESERDESFALTIPKAEGKRVLRLNFGNWAVIGFYGPQTPQGYIVSVSMKQGIPGLKSSDTGFDQNPAELQMRFYDLPFAEMNRLTGSVAADVEESFRFMGQRFAGRSRCLYRNSNIPIVASAVFHPEQRQALLTGGIVEPNGEENNFVFSKRTFELMEGINANPQLSYYQENQADFKRYIEEPFQSVMNTVAASLPAEITTVMESERRIFSRFPKNDYGQGGAWPHYWGAFYPKGSKRSLDAQLSMSIHHDRLEYGFYIGEYGSTQRQRFVRNCAAYGQVLEELMAALIDSRNVIFGDPKSYVGTGTGGVAHNDQSTLDWNAFVANPDRYNCDVSFVMAKSVVLTQEHASLAESVHDGHVRLFPLVLAAIYDDPLPHIHEYVAHQFPGLIEPEASQPVNPPYPLIEIAEATGFPLETLAAWVSGVKRKGQAILYGPPGTGKTFLAEHLARHLVGSGDGFVDVVQFHPAYAYEDFMQGIRPRPLPNGGLEYPVVPGRFVEFCQEAARRQGVCVLIVDEINRANLARVFGELMYLLEYRHKEIPLAAGGQRFRIPENVHIIGTMNTADRSIALVDHALRRRFAFLEVSPNYEVLQKYLAKCAPDFPRDRLVNILERLNRRIDDPHYEVGISYFMNENLGSALQDIWCMEIQPYLDEYFFDQRGAVSEFAWGNIRNELEL